MLDKRVINLFGADLFENKFVIPGWLFSRTQVVAASESQLYFGQAVIVPDTEHFSIAKPTSRDHPSHLFLVEFYTSRFPST